MKKLLIILVLWPVLAFPQDEKQLRLGAGSAIGYSFIELNSFNNILQQEFGLTFKNRQPAYSMFITIGGEKFQAWSEFMWDQQKHSNTITALELRSIAGNVNFSYAILIMKGKYSFIPFVGFNQTQTFFTGSQISAAPIDFNEIGTSTDKRSFSLTSKENYYINIGVQIINISEFEIMNAKDYNIGVRGGYRVPISRDNWKLDNALEVNNLPRISQGFFVQGVIYLY